jgi:hypothetical protein
VTYMLWSKGAHKIGAVAAGGDGRVGRRAVELLVQQEQLPALNQQAPKSEQ